MISHVDASSELLWQLTKSHNAHLKTSVNNTRFSNEAGNLTAEHSFKASGLANGATAVDIQELADAAKAATVVNGKKCAGTFRSQVGETKLACAGRADLEKAALARVSALHKAGRVARAN
eukprot:CAMPEP_0179721656 /NCGR_PEP_ID=MMETSP0938-20121108/4594_1 /TAXON_ID=548131 ORGANISM="Ostreococcus mediterraneus, Strain clade-D-RCC1107" /NCGR_SAMPLE_ID=MMETSP0938 /ASSEMBLY_ACC=CAM_ASM_000576 /LENGTH=119 /DNA_ID=CAMNT_0021595611 /DNA_START=182 /DNA_END=541 /DNA_ORIENTATION=+